MRERIDRPRSNTSTRQNQLGQELGLKGMQTRRRLLDAIETLMRSTSLLDLHVSQIAKMADTSTATFYVYFSDVPEAALALIGEVSQSPPAALSALSEPWTGDAAFEKAQDLVSSYVDHWMSNAGLFRARDLASDEGSEAFTAVRIQAVTPLVNAIARHVGERQSAGELPHTLHPVSAARVLLALIERIAALSLVPQGFGVTPARLARVAAYCAVQLIGRGAPIFDTAGHRAWNAGLRDDDREALSAELWAIGPARSNLQKNYRGQTIGVKGAQTRRRLMEITNDLLQTRPLRKISVSDITKGAGVSASNFYLYFQDVPAVVLALLDEMSQSTPEMLALCTNSWTRPSAELAALVFVRAYLGQWQSHNALFRVRNLAAEEGDRRFMRVRLDSIGPHLNLITQRISDRLAAAELPGDLHPRSTAGALLALLERVAGLPANTAEGRIGLEMMARSAALFMVVLTGAPSDSNASAS
jgi:AcrR family transcriptional regulator